MEITNEFINGLEEEARKVIIGIWRTGKIPDDEIAAKNSILNYTRSKYLQLTDQMNLDDNDKELFFWLEGSITLHMILVSDLNNPASIEMIAEKSEIDDVIFHDCLEQTKDYSIAILSSPERKLYLISNGIIDSINKEKIIPSTISEHIITLSDLVSKWVRKEFKSADHLIKPSIETIDFNQAIIRSKKYNLDNMSETVGDAQFTAELNECIFSYEHEKWFVCAAGLGGVLEHLLYLILEKNNMLDKQFPDNATYNDYIGYMSREPISIKKREKTMIKNIFNIRNSVSHFNQGFTSKDQCTYLMNGIRDVFNNYYVKNFNLNDK